MRSPSAVAVATVRIWAASPSAWLINDCFSPSDWAMAAALAPSARLMRACISPSDWAMAARFSLSARICFSIASITVTGGVMSRIS